LSYAALGKVTVPRNSGNWICRVSLLCRVQWPRHSAKAEDLPWHSTKSPSPFSRRPRHFFLLRVPRKSTRQTVVCCLKLDQVTYAKGGTRQTFCRVLLGLCQVALAPGQWAVSGSEDTRILAFLGVMFEPSSVARVQTKA
jgi:hypothetical protein